MTISVRECELRQIERFRDIYRHEMNCQIIHDSIHGRLGWTREYALFMNETLAGYGSVAISGPWRDTPTLYEFFVIQPWRCRIFDFYIALQESTRFAKIETQSNDALLTNMLQELKRICYAGGSVPAARCNVGNVASRKTLQRAGFVPCGHIISGELFRGAETAEDSRCTLDNESNT